MWIYTQQKKAPSHLDPVTSGSLIIISRISLSKLLDFSPGKRKNKWDTLTNQRLLITKITEGMILLGKLSKDFWLFGSFFYLYYFIWAVCTTFFSLWLTNKMGLTSTEAGIVFSAVAIAAMCFQPFFGIISDKLGFKKNLMWVFIALLVFIAPFFIYIFPFLLQSNIFLGAIIGGAYLGACFNGGCGAIEAYIEKVSRVKSFEYGQVRMFGSLGAATAVFITGRLFSTDPNLLYWISSLAAVVLAIVFALTKITNNNEMKKTEIQEATSKKSILETFKNRKFWFLIIYVVGVGCIYEVFDQQFPVYFTQFFSSPSEGAGVFGNLLTIQTFMEACVMIIAPFFIIKIGAKNALIYCGCIMSIRIIGSGFADDAVVIILLKLMHALEVPILLVAIFKYINEHFNAELSATIYLIAFQFSKQIGATFLSAIAGNMYDTVGFKDAYLLLGFIALFFTIISVFTLSGSSRIRKNPSITETA
ncbi:MFS transporter [Bacillus gobiensis]|uniref:MFS transporter n=2 Tax=Bacillus gobiensis TaxID=1441095 RepID=UPI003D1C2CF6